MFDEYIEELNTNVKYGILYTYRASSNYYDRSNIDSEYEEKLTLALKLQALHDIREAVNNEFEVLREQYERIINE